MSAVTTQVIEKTNYTHDAMVDLIVANPCITQGELAKHFGYTPGWISQVIRSDAFREVVARRKQELVDPLILQSVEKRFEELVRVSQEVLLEKLKFSPTADLALKAAELGARALGYGAKQPGVQINQQFVVHAPLKAATSEEWLEGRTLMAQQP